MFRGSDIRTHSNQGMLYIDKIDFSAGDRQQLRYFFLNDLISNNKVSEGVKEQFRDYLGKAIGVPGLEGSPRYTNSKKEMSTLGAFDRPLHLSVAKESYESIERLYGLKEYGALIGEARTLTEMMVKYLLADRGAPWTNLDEGIEYLYSNRSIDEKTRENFDRIRLAGNDKLHEGVAKSETAEEVYRLIKKEYQIFLLNNQ